MFFKIKFEGKTDNFSKTQLARIVPEHDLNFY